MMILSRLTRAVSYQTAGIAMRRRHRVDLQATPWCGVIGCWLFVGMFGIAIEVDSTSVSAQTRLPANQKRVLPAPSPDKPAKTAKYDVKKNVIYTEAAGQELRGDLYIPHGEGPFPAVLMLHGGGWRAGTKSQMLIPSRRLADLGFVAMSINYRLAPKHKFPAQIHDCKAAVRWMRDHADDYKIDPERIGVYGYSAGGHLACLLGTTDPSYGLEGIEEVDSATSSRVQAVVAGGAPCDLRIVPPDLDFLTYWLGGTRLEKPEMYSRASPINAISGEDPPTLFYHGENDWLVPSDNAKRMYDQLVAVGVRAEFYLCPDKGHVNAFMNKAAMERAEQFLMSVLGSSHANVTQASLP